MSNSVQSYGQQPSRVLCPQDSPGNNTGVGCHFLLPENDYLTINLTKRERRIIKIINPDKLDFIAISQQANAPTVTTSKKLIIQNSF